MEMFLENALETRPIKFRRCRIAKKAKNKADLKEEKSRLVI